MKRMIGFHLDVSLFLTKPFEMKFKGDERAMPQAIHTVEVALNNEVVWDFTKDFNAWAPLISGYLAHEVQNDMQFHWVFKADLGFTKKTIKLQVDIQEVTAPSDVKFKLTGLSDSFNGHGYFKLHKVNETTTQFTGSLDLSASGMMGMMINPVLETFVPQMTEQLIVAIKAKLNGEHSISI
ncbi:MAG: SRPBCC family protein [Solibacillus sp.]